MDLLLQCFALRQAGYVPYARKLVRGKMLECISYPFPSDDSTSIGIMMRQPDDPTTMFEHFIPKSIVEAAIKQAVQV